MTVRAIDCAEAYLRLKPTPDSSQPPQEALADHIIRRAISSLRPYPNNPRRHSREQVKALGRSIHKFGWTRPVIIDDSGTILCGHGCVQAAEEMGHSQVPTLTLHGLSQAEKRAL